MSELKPCPFCGAKARLWRWNKGTRIDCSEWDSKQHLVGVYGATDEEAIERWNRRADWHGEQHDAAAADVRENVPGKWLHTDAAPHRVYCSVCYATYLRNEKWAEELPIKLHPQFCQNCGAQMEEDQR